MAEVRTRPLDELAGRITDLTPVLEAIGIEMASRTAKSFDEHGHGHRGGPKWPPRKTPNVAGMVHDLSISANIRPHRFQGQPVLIDTGRLRNSISHQVQGDAVAWGSGVLYSKNQHFGIPSTIPITPAIKANAIEAAGKPKYAKYAALLIWISNQEAITVRPKPRPIVGFYPDDEKVVTEIIEDFVLEGSGG